MVAARLEHVVAAASARRDELSATRAQHTSAIGAVRDQVRELTQAQTRLTDALHRDEVAKAQAALRIEQLSEQVLEQFGMAADDLIAEYGPHIELPPSQQEIDEYEQARERGEQGSAPLPMPFDRDTQERRAKRAEKDLRELGKVNPLALEEFAALEERYNFLSTQLEDVKAARKDLLDVVADVDERILQVFTEAYADVEREFKGVFSSLFPGGEGRLVLTDPNDMLTTGIEVEARPPGKKVKRLSLLSGGEKSLTAVAMLVAIFRARPSPFYVMDEVEAALRDTQERRAKRAEKDLRELGKVNPLALEEFAALEERYNFLSTQLEDVKAARKDLLDVVADVDERILQVFTEAYADVEREFKGVFSSLFPGGEGRLVLTDPNDMLTTGIEVEARPPGKKVKRLSLLSGGEKSLTAVAMLVAIFRARPSPFYVMDEVEAALDDVNLQRLIGLFEQLREKSQLIVITHQKPTMEVADALYGVSMRDDGITQVVSQRMRGLETQLASQNA
ncbi:chromosome partition protein Smc [Mycobacteroides abscessus]|nr:chromosome partition protein Smc [Mycobacteroides abscessus]